MQVHFAACQNFLSTNYLNCKSLTISLLHRWAPSGTSKAVSTFSEVWALSKFKGKKEKKKVSMKKNTKLMSLQKSTCDKACFYAALPLNRETKGNSMTGCTAAETSPWHCTGQQRSTGTGESPLSRLLASQHHTSPHPKLLPACRHLVVLHMLGCKKIYSVLPWLRSYVNKHMVQKVLSTTSYLPESSPPPVLLQDSPIVKHSGSQISKLQCEPGN